LAISPIGTQQDATTFTSPVTVTVTDASGNYVANGTIVTLTLNGSGTLSPSPTTALTTSGVATFSNLSVAPPGSYTIAASYPGDPNFTASSGTAAGTLTVAPASSPYRPPV